MSRLRKPRQQSLWVSLAGPAVNILLSALGYAICEYAIHVSVSQNQFNIGEAIGLVNLVLAVFNLIPIPPLDGSAIIERFLPNRSLAKYYQLRARALPIVFIALILLTWTTNIAGTWLAHIENWWFNLL